LRLISRAEEVDVEGGLGALGPDPTPDPHASWAGQGHFPPRKANASEPAPRASELLKHWDAVRRSARKLMRDSCEAEDLAHDTFERALRSLDRFEPGTNMRGWLYTIMVRLARDHFRRRHARRPGDVDLERMAAPEDDSPPAWCRVSSAQILGAMGELSTTVREVFELHELDNLSYAEIAQRMGIPVNTVASRLRRARERLRDLLLESLAVSL
jgi:RNA polymerase sigma-70 factor (ECF subfamily)